MRSQTRPGHALIGGYPMSDIARTLSSFVGGRPVADRTGLTGIYDLELSRRRSSSLGRQAANRCLRLTRIGHRSSQLCKSNWDSSWRLRPVPSKCS